MTNIRNQVLIIFSGLYLLGCLIGCTSLLTSAGDLLKSEKVDPYVVLARHDKSGRCSILVKDLGLPVSISPHGPLPYSKSASGALWVGTEFPFDKAIAVLKFCRNYYPEWRYISLSDYTNPGLDKLSRELYVGGSTERALCMGLQTWTDREKQKLYATRSQASFHKMIRAKYNGKKYCSGRIE